MQFRDWRDAQAYDFGLSLSPAQWAWEFLRRNRDYQREWEAFMAVWNALEAAYGRPPNRDFCAWTRDRRSWVPASECPDGECRVDGDKVLIECALGARWGFIKFPPGPGDDDPVGGGRLAWRERPRSTVLVDASAAAWLGQRPDRVALGFDLALPLREQVERAKRKLQMLQRERMRSGDVALRNVRALAPGWIEALRWLDAEADGADDATLALLAGEQGVVAGRARTLCAGGYLDILLVPGT